MLNLITHSKIAGADEQRLQHLPHDILLDTETGIYYYRKWATMMVKSQIYPLTKEEVANKSYISKGDVYEGNAIRVF